MRLSAGLAHAEVFAFAEDVIGEPVNRLVVGLAGDVGERPLAAAGADERPGLVALALPEAMDGADLRGLLPGRPVELAFLRQRKDELVAVTRAAIGDTLAPP